MHRCLQIVCLVLVLMCGVATTAIAQNLFITDLGTEGEGEPGNPPVTSTYGLIIEGNGFIEGTLHVQVMGHQEDMYYFIEQVQDQTELTISTTVPSAPEDRLVDVWASTSWGYVSRQFTLQGTGQLEIFGPDTLWFFNGAQPTNYSTSVTLQSSAGSSTQWSVVAGSNRVALSTTQGGSVVVTSIGASASLFDVTVRASANGVSVDKILSVRSPHRLAAVSTTTTCPVTTWGYRTLVRYGIRDQFGSALPNGASLNENWTTGVSNLWSGTNWRRGSPGGVTISISTFDDTIEGEQAGRIPATSCASSTSVQSWGQAWYIGSTTPGVGKRVQTNTLFKRRGNALHTNIVSPAP